MRYRAGEERLRRDRTRSGNGVLLVPQRYCNVDYWTTAGPSGKCPLGVSKHTELQGDINSLSVSVSLCVLTHKGFVYFPVALPNTTPLQ